MPIIFLFPVAVIVFVIIASRKAAEQKKRAEAMQQAEQTKPVEAPSEGQTAYKPVKPTVQTFPERKAEQPKRPVQQRTRQNAYAQAPKHPEHDLCALRPEEHKDGDAHERSNDAVHNDGTLLSFTPDNILQGVVFSEIFGKPKALR